MTKLYVKNGVVQATHDDAQNVLASVYGEGTTIFMVPDWTGEIGDRAPQLSAAETDAAIIAAATSQIDAIADAIYTSSPSRVARYERKLDEAKRYIAAGYPNNVALADYPTLVQEAPARGITKRQLADTIVAAAASFAQLAGYIEAQRAELSSAVAAEASIEGKSAAAAVIVAAVEAAAAQAG